jgi:DNA (cytosine-5)-methyltransferase 1
MSRRSTFRVVDLFAGAGGTSTGLALAAAAAGIPVELTAVNHWETAVETHAANHPWAQHYCEPIDSLDPRRVVRGKLDLLVASPECTHHSSARGGKPMSDQSRSTAWCVVRWAEALQPRTILVENVREFESWGPLRLDGRPMKSRAGETFQAWVQALRATGYRVAWKVLCAADYGDPTTRRRLFVLAWRGRGQAPWGMVTHSDRGRRDLFGKLEPWRAAREVIDWSIQGQSIFERKKPLAEKTLARIAEGLRRFGGIQEPFVIPQQSSGSPRPVSDPLPTLAAKGAVSLIEPFLVPRYGERPTQAPRVHSLDDPMPTIPATCQHGLAEPFLVSYYGTGGAQPVSRPVPTITARDRFGLVQPGQIDIRFRMLQPHELSAAMGFPADYRFAGNKTEVIRQIGNAVPVGTAQALCAGIIDEAVGRAVAC